MNGNETQQTIASWADGLFGPTNPKVKLLKLFEEVKELSSAIWEDDNEHTAEEIADVAIVLMHMTEIIGKDLQTLINNKMAINRSRTWIQDENGNFKHLKK